MTLTTPHTLTLTLTYRPNYRTTVTPVLDSVHVRSTEAFPSFLISLSCPNTTLNFFTALYSNCNTAHAVPHMSSCLSCLSCYRPSQTLLLFFYEALLHCCPVCRTPVPLDPTRRSSRMDDASCSALQALPTASFLLESVLFLLSQSSWSS